MSNLGTSLRGREGGLPCTKYGFKTLQLVSPSKYYSREKESKWPTRTGSCFGNVFLKHLEILKYLLALTTVVLK